MPKNEALQRLCDGMVKAWDIYAKPNSVILFIIEDISYNICDQRFHEFYIRETYPHIKVLRRTLTQVHREGKLGQNKELLLCVEYSRIYIEKLQTANLSFCFSLPIAVQLRWLSSISVLATSLAIIPRRASGMPDI